MKPISPEKCLMQHEKTFRSRSFCGGLKKILNIIAN